MKRITSDDLNTGLYEIVPNTDPLVCQKANYYALHPDPLDPKWDIITYFRMLGDTSFTYVRKSIDGVSVRWDNRTENDWLEDLKNLNL
jgi:hypothetical protein